MIKSLIVDKTCMNMRLDRLLRYKLGNLPQSLIEKSLRSGKIKVNKKKVKSSFKVSINDKIDLFNFNFKEKIIQKKIKFIPNKHVIKDNITIKIDGNTFGNEEYRHIQYLSEILANDDELYKEDLPCEFILGNLQITINDLTTYENDLIICD